MQECSEDAKSTAEMYYAPRLGQEEYDEFEKGMLCLDSSNLSVQGERYSRFHEFISLQLVHCVLDETSYECASPEDSKNYWSDVEFLVAYSEMQIDLKNQTHPLQKGKFSSQTLDLGKNSFTTKTELSVNELQDSRGKLGLFSQEAETTSFITLAGYEIIDQGEHNEEN